MAGPAVANVGPEMALAEALFRRLAEATADPPGVTRASYGDGERFAHRLLAETARDFGLETSVDFVGNLYLTLPGRDRQAPRLIIGSHLDSVPHGGNFDGAAGVVAALAVLAWLRRRGMSPAQDVVAMAVRAEEASWFPVNYIGSRAAFGVLPADALAARRRDSDRPLAEHLTEEGFDADAVRAGRAHLVPAAIRHYLELHIEQGPRLVEENKPVGIVTGIRGTARYRHGRILGAYGHAAAPRHSRRDAVVAGAALVGALDRKWQEIEASGADFVCTVGEFATDPAHHSLIKVPGEVRFTLDMRSDDDALLDMVVAWLAGQAASLGAERRVTIDLGPAYRSASAPMDPALRAELKRQAAMLGIPAIEMPSGAGHDAMVFAHQGVPSAMIFVRNDKGSHNPEESMRMDDFADACRLLFGLVAALG